MLTKLQLRAASLRAREIQQIAAKSISLDSAEHMSPPLPGITADVGYAEGPVPGTVQLEGQIESPLLGGQ